MRKKIFLVLLLIACSALCGCEKKDTFTYCYYYVRDNEGVIYSSYVRHNEGAIYSSFDCSKVDVTIPIKNDSINSPYVDAILYKDGLEIIHCTWENTIFYYPTEMINDEDYTYNVSFTPFSEDPSLNWMKPGRVIKKGEYAYMIQAGSSIYITSPNNVILQVPLER